MSHNGDIAARLAQRIGEGDATAESELYHHYGRPLRLMLVRRTRDPQLAADLCQEAFVIAIRKLRAGEVRKPDALAAFLRQTAVNLSIEHYRREKRYTAQDDGIIELHAPHTEEKAQQVDQVQVRALLEQVLDQLGQPRDREILYRFYLLDQDKMIICQALQLSAAHFDRVLYRAKQRMRDMLEEQADVRAVLLGEVNHG